MSQTSVAEKIKPLSEMAPRYLREGLIPFEPQGDWGESVAQYWGRCRTILLEKIDAKVSADRVVRLQSLMMDQMVTRLYRRGLEESQVSGELRVPMVLLAQGGYGRAELNLGSDLDLLVLYSGKSSPLLETIVNKMLYPLWDAKLKVGYAIRTLEECHEAMKADVQVMSSLLDARFLAGDSNLALEFFRSLESKVSSSRAIRQFIRAKLSETDTRLKKFGGSVYVVEPNLKESEGGLRDWHTLRYFCLLATKSPRVEDWVRARLISDEEAEQLHRALNFLWEVRNRLHRLANKAQDQIMFAFQKPLALEMGFESDTQKLEAEKFMQTYYGYASDLLRLRKEVTRRIVSPPRSTWRRLQNRFRPSLSEYFLNLSGKVFPKSFRKLEQNPVEIMRAFSLAQKRGLVLDEGFKAWISRHLHWVDDTYRRHPEVCRLFQEMAADIQGFGNSLNEMHDCRFLGAFMPEFGEILHQTQHDVYHVYTVDTHSIKAVQELSLLQSGAYDQEFPLFKKALSEVGHPAVLSLGVLFHDIGKGKGGSHSEVGARLARQIMERLHYVEEEICQVEFLVLSHLMMPHLSQRRDLEDANMISQFARTMETRERLSELFILTWADIRAVGPEVWTPWKGSLLSHLYEKTLHVIEKGEFGTDRAAVLMEEVKRKTLATVTDSVMPQKDLEAFLDSMPPRYFLVNGPAQILQHAQWVLRAGHPAFFFHQAPNLERKCNDVFIYTINTPRLFEQVTGVMAANQVNILALEQFFNSTGEALIQLQVTDHRGAFLEEDRRFVRIAEDLQSVTMGKLRLDSYYESRAHSALLKASAPQRSPQVEIDKDVSPYYTLIDIYTDDRVGILYDLARVMRQMNLFVEVSKISTKVDQVSDVFYVKDIFGHKINDKKKLEAIRAALLEVLTQSGS